ncbi:hypothetical protein ZWY2020_059058 [Hordeum vulgare]|nr:hypothetical protein ZWY2020_059058 [Hordeum vulgare]
MRRSPTLFLWLPSYQPDTWGGCASSDPYPCNILRQHDGTPEVGGDLISAGLRPSSAETRSRGKTVEVFGRAAFEKLNFFVSHATFPNKMLLLDPHHQPKVSLLYLVIYPLFHYERSTHQMFVELLLEENVWSFCCVLRVINQVK